MGKDPWGKGKDMFGKGKDAWGWGKDAGKGWGKGTRPCVEAEHCRCSQSVAD